MSSVLNISAVDPATDQLTITAHGLNTGDGPGAMYTGAGVLPDGLAPVTDYWVIRVDANTIKLATSNANALAGTAIDILDEGSGTLQLLVGLPYRRNTTYAPKSQIRSADLNALEDDDVALFCLLSGQAQSIYGAVSLAVAFNAKGGIVVPSGQNLGLQGTMAITNEVTVAAFTGVVDDYAPAGLAAATVLRIPPLGAGVTVDGIAGGSDGRVLWLVNVTTSGGNIILAHEAAGSVAANRFSLPGSINLTIRENASVLLRYDATASRWRVATP